MLGQKPGTIEAYRMNLRDVIQKICLLGLWRGGFFEYAAFYGGTALRMMYGLNRFSEDLDFSLFEARNNFQLGDYLNYVRIELKAWGITADVDVTVKSDSNIESAFIKANTMKTLLNLKVPPSEIKRLHRDEISHVKFEVDPQPPCTFDKEFRFVLEPIPFSVCTMSPHDLFAGKMHAVLARGWQNRVKGRDWYDLIWFVQNGIPLNLNHLEARLKQSGHMIDSANLDIPTFKQMLLDRIKKLDLNYAKSDVLPFIPNPSILQNWSVELFVEIADRILIT